MKAKFTKGEWRFDGYEIKSDGCLIELAKITVFNQGKANGYLIAAAPDMYELLSKISVMMECEHGVNTSEINELLAKARGDKHEP